MAKKPKKPVDDPKSKKAKAKAKQREEEEDEEEEDDEPEEESSSQKKPKSGVYVGLGAITLVAFLTAGVFFYLDSEFHTKQPPTVNIDVIGLTANAPKAAN